MTGPIYKLWVGRPTEAWYQLSEEERAELMAKNEESFEKVGGKTIVACFSGWSNEKWPMFGVDEYPDIEAVGKHVENQWRFDWHRYTEPKTMLGTEMPSQS